MDVENLNKKPLMDDSDIANLVQFSQEWVRAQRRARRLNKDHVLTVDPVMVGSKPRYNPEDIWIWFEALKGNIRQTNTV